MAIRVWRNIYDLEFHRSQIYVQHFIFQCMSKTCNDFYGFHNSNAADHPDTAPKTGNSRVQIGGWPGYKQAKQGVSLGIIVVT